MKNFNKLILPVVTSTLLSINSCGKQPELYPVEQLTPVKIEKLANNESVNEEQKKLLVGKSEVKTGLLSVDDPDIPQAVKDRFNKMVLLSSDKGDCHANPAKIDSKKVYLTSAHCEKKLQTFVNEKHNLLDAPVYSVSLEGLKKSDLSKVKIFQFPKIADGALIYMAIPTIKGNSDSRKIFVGHKKELNTENGILITTEEQFQEIEASGSSGSFVSDKNGRLLGTLKGWMRVNRNLTEASYAAGNKLKESTQHLVANTGRKTDNSKRVIKYTDAGVFGFGDGSFENWVPDSQKQKN